MFYAHSLDDRDDKSEWHLLKEHLEKVGTMAASFAHEFGADNAAKAAGLLHDLGKYSAKFQARLCGSSERADHSTAGAHEVANCASTSHDKIISVLLSYAIAGHHAGLADYDELQRRITGAIESINDMWQTEINANVGALWPGHFQPTKENAAFQLAFLGRMIFSCLVDADYKDTEAFYARHKKYIVDRSWPDLRKHMNSLIARFDGHMGGMSNLGALNILRHSILRHVRSKATLPKGLFTLTVPTGGGKTLASLGFALDHAKAHNLRRIVYAIPFTSIIDQNAAIFREILGNDYILEHHASIDEKKTGQEARDKLRLAMEDWGAPVIVTTNVQLFESLFANRPSHCRKLHNLANSVIILDEVQTLPLNLLRPCLAALNELAAHYGTSIVLCTATQPAFDKREFKHGEGMELEGRELAPTPSHLARQLKRITIRNENTLDDTQLVDALGEKQQGLIIVNSRRHALALYQEARKRELEGVIHLTTRQYAADRRAILSRVRENLRQGAPCRLIATSLVEAGVDVDFPRVWRAEAGLDQIAQAAGRCNREGKHSPEESVVTIFNPKDHRPPREIEQLAAAFRAVENKFDDLLSPDAMKAYFLEVFWSKGRECLDNKKILELFSASSGRPAFDYRKAAEQFRMIESNLQPIIVNNRNEVEAVLGRLNSSDISPGKAARELQPYIVQVPKSAFESLRNNGRVAYWRVDLWEDQFAVLDDRSLYTAEVGLLWEEADVLENTIF